MKNKKLTTEQVLVTTTAQFAKDITNLTERRQTALSVFRSTAESLEVINADLAKSITNFDELTHFIAEQRAAASQMVSDNDKVRNKILEIIGE